MRFGRTVGVGLALMVVLAGCGKSRQGGKGPTPTPRGTPTPSILQEESVNGPPKVTDVVLSPARPTIRDDIQADVKTHDPDGDYVSLRYQWLVNGKALLGQISETLRAGTAVRGDKVQLQVTPSDARGNEGPPFLSETVTVRNSPPELVEQLRAGQSVNGYQMKVMDPDGDPISFTLENAPPSMRIDQSGTIHWSPDSGDKPGLYKVTMVAADGHGGSVKVVFPVQVTPPG